ncbi:hypothetical protein HNR27_000486 [Ornithinibacillus bavariensis]
MVSQYISSIFFNIIQKYVNLADKPKVTLMGER